MHTASSRRRRIGVCRLLMALGLLWVPAASDGALPELDLREAVVVTAVELSRPERSAVTLLLEEVEGMLAYVI